MLFIPIIIILVWFVSIDIHTNYLSIVYVMFYSYPLSYYHKQIIKIYWSLYQGLLFCILLLYRYCVIVSNSGTPFRKVSAIYCNYSYYDSIHLADFYNYYFLLGFHDQIYFQYKNIKQHKKGTIFHTGCDHWIQEKFEVQADHWERFFFCWKLTGKIVAKLIWCFNQSVLVW